MAIHSGLNSYFGWSKEVTYGTVVTAATFAPFTSQTLTAGIDWAPILSDSIIAGNLVRSKSLSTAGPINISGNVTMDLPREGCAELLEFCFGTDATTGSDPYTHTYAMAADLPSFTCAIGLPSNAAGVVHEFQFEGCKVTDFTLSVATGENVVLDMTIAAETVSTQTAQTPSYSSIEFFRYSSAPYTIDAAGVCVSDFSVSMNNGLNSSKMCLGQTTIDEPVQTAYRTGTVTATGTFEDLTEYAAFQAHTTTAFVVTATEGTDVLTITTQGEYRSGAAPTSNGTDLVSQTYVAELLGDDADSDAALNVVLVNNEA